MRIGILALQGDFTEHMAILSRLNADAVLVRLPQQLGNIDGLIIPGGESTTISKLMLNYDLVEPIRKLAHQGLPVWGTCAGMVLLAGKVINSEVASLQIMNIEVKRNAFGRQADSFETELSIPVLNNDPFLGVFIRAPVIVKVAPDVGVLCRLSDGTVVAAKEKNILASAFHPELTDDLRVHRYFLDIVARCVK